MKTKYSSFSYKPGNSPVHKIPAWIKIIIIPALNILVFNLPWYFSAGFVIFQFILCCCLKFSLKEQFADLKPVLWYGVLLFLFDFISHKKIYFDLNTAFLLLKLFGIMQSASLMFKTSTSLEIRNGIGQIEGVIRKILHLKKKNTLTNTISLFVCFIPAVFKIWEQSKKAWIARGGKKNLKMISTLLPVLFSVGMKQAYNRARAISVREE